MRRGALAKSISELASDWLVLTQDIVFLPCFHGIRLWFWPEPLVAPRVRRALGTRMSPLMVAEVRIRPLHCYTQRYVKDSGLYSGVIFLKESFEVNLRDKCGRKLFPCTLPACRAALALAGFPIEFGVGDFLKKVVRCQKYLTKGSSRASPCEDFEI